MLLTIDAGNTRIKWGLFDAEGNLLKSGTCLHTEIAQTKLPDATQIAISNVAGAHIKKLLESILPEHVPAHWMTVTATECGVKNSYVHPEKLGTDRWAALIAAWHIKQAPCVVVNAGTAVTVDALNMRGEFIGGMILPGIDLMQQSLGMATAQLPSISAAQSSTSATNQYQDIFAKNTVDAMRAGAIYAACGAIMQMHKALFTQSNQAPFILISGGNAPLIRDNLLGDVTKLTVIVDNLVLRGLYCIATLSKSENQ